MSFENPLLSRDCVNCPDQAPTCNCASNEICNLIARSCSTCPSVQCVAKQSSSNPHSSGSSKGAVAGAVIGSLILLASAVLLLLWYRRRSRARMDGSSREVKEDAPASAETVLNRPNPTEKPATPIAETHSIRTYPSHSTLHETQLRPEEQHQYSPSGSLLRNPFDDQMSIQTTGTEGSNVIPIGLVPAASVLSDSPSQTLTVETAGPVRPPRSPDLDLNFNLDHVNVSREASRAGSPYTQSQRSGVSGMTRNSYMSGASYASDFIHEAPMIMTPTRGTVRQVLGVVKAEVIQAPKSNPTSPKTGEGLKPQPRTSRAPTKSPLAATSFGPSDVVTEVSDEQDISVNNPFGDQHSPQGSPNSVLTFGTPSPRPNHSSHGSDWVPEVPHLPWSRSNGDSRPSSMSTQAGSIIADIGNATRVYVGGGGATPNSTGQSFPMSSPYKTAMGRLITPKSSGKVGTLAEQQQFALAHAQAQAQAQGLDRRVSGSSVVSRASTRADSILESFPFVPPSPISDRPVRSPPVSPLAQHSFRSVSPSGDPPTKVDDKLAPSTYPLDPPPSRRTLGLSTASQLSTASSGLGSFPFQIDTGNDPNNAPSAFKEEQGRTRASLDTLALTNDLSSYPLGFDQDPVDGHNFSKR